MARELHLIRRPDILVSRSDFAVAEVSLPPPGPGQVLVRNRFMSVDPYMRRRMSEQKNYGPAFKLDEAPTGAAVGEVVAGSLPAGTPVFSMKGWRDCFVDSVDELRIIDPALAPLSAWLGAFGLTGLTAYIGLMRIARLQEGERVLISAASGAVGQIACQIARNKGCSVVGLAGSDAKCHFLTDVLKVDAINYRSCGDLSAEIALAFPDGIDVAFENVGAAPLEAALNNMRMHGRIVLCGMIEQYNTPGEGRGPGNLINAITKEVTIQGFAVLHHLDLLDEFVAAMAGWLGQNKLTWRETIFEGLERAPDALISLLKGDNFGKTLVKIDPA